MNAAGPIFLMLLAGGVMLAVGKGLDDQTVRSDSFAILRGKGAESVVRLDLSEGWHVKTTGLKKGNATALFAPGGTDRITA